MSDPTRGLQRKDFGVEGIGERSLENKEIRLLFEQLPTSGLAVHWQLEIGILLATGVRIGELVRARWADVDVDEEEGVWRIPVENSKTGTAHTIYLSEFARTRFQALRDLAKGSVWVMPSPKRKDHHLDTKSLTKQLKAGQLLILSGGTWTPHDLRRTVATCLGDLDVRPEVIEKCLNHKQKNRILRTYQRQGYKAEQKDAWIRLGKHLEMLESTNVIPVNFNQVA
jgi:integrase